MEQFFGGFVIIYRPSDRIPVKVADVTFWLSPLTFGQKTELLSLVHRKEGEENIPAAQFSEETIRRVLKRIDGIQEPDGSKFELEFGQDGLVTLECVQDLMCMDFSAALVTYAGNFALQAVKDYNLEGAVVDFSNVESIKKKSLESNQVH